VSTQHVAQFHFHLSGNRVGLEHLLSSNISVIRPSIHLALAVCLAGHVIHSHHEDEHCEDSFQFTACALILLRDTGGGGVDIGTASVTLAEMRKACLKEDLCDWSRPGTSEWVTVLQAVESAFAHKKDIETLLGANVSIIELAMVVRASKFIHTILAPPPPAADFINFTVRIPHKYHTPPLLLLTCGVSEVRAYRHYEPESKFGCAGVRSTRCGGLCVHCSYLRCTSRRHFSNQASDQAWRRYHAKSQLPPFSATHHQFQPRSFYPNLFFAALDINAAPVVSSPKLSPTSSIDCSRDQPALPLHSPHTLITVYLNDCSRNCRIVGCCPFQRCCLRFACNSSSH
jgi:hypothetical protein